MRLPVAACLLPMLLAACARVPQEAVTLSDTVGKDIAAVHTAHVSLAREYFASMRETVNGFVDDVYRPFVIRRSIEELGLVGELQAAVASPAGTGAPDALDILEIYADEAIRQIEAFRREMLAPIARQEERLLADLDRTYGAMLRGNAAVTAHLRSVSRVQGAQRDALADLGLPGDVRERIGEGAAGLSRELERLLAAARGAEERIDELPARVDALADAYLER